jgi:hypothetical protein
LHKLAGLTKITLILIIILIFTLPLLAGANCSSGYRHFTWKKEPAYFTFEYPVGYRIDEIDDEDPDFVTIWMNKPRGRELINVILSIDFYQSIDTADEELGICLSGIEKIYPDTQVLERSTISVAGEQAEQVFYSFTFPLYYGEGRFYEPALIPEIGRLVVFKKDDVIWVVEIDSEEHLADAVEVDLDHILQTFEILD